VESTFTTGQPRRNACKLGSSRVCCHHGRKKAFSAVSGFGSDAGGSGAQAPASRIRARRAPAAMWVIYLEMLVVLAVAALIVWWTWPRKK
jgi:hypothetical protein